MKKDIDKLVAELTLEEKASLCSGKDFWRTKSVERLGIPAAMVSDGPHGLRKQDERAQMSDINDSIVAVCFPAASATASTFDRDALRELGELLGDECRAEQLWLLLGPAINIKRSPLCGRNFEYLSEDPYLAGELAAEYVAGVQSKQVGTSLKHFAANSQEHERMNATSNIDERTLREIYLAAFETVVKRSQPWSVMCSYNKLNGVFMSENKRLLSDILRDEWGFTGLVVSDWGAVSDRILGVEAGLDLEMPGGADTDLEIVKAVKSGQLDEAYLDRNVKRILEVLFRLEETHEKPAPFDRAAHHQKAIELAEKCLVLLKNDDGFLPISPKSSQKIAVIGGFAEKVRYQGGGSSHVNSFKVESTLEHLRAAFPDLVYARGFSSENNDFDENLLKEAISAAKNADKVLIFAGLPDSYESEGFDRKDMKLPSVHDRIIHEIIRANPNTAVILHNGSPVELPWAADAKAILLAGLLGEGAGAAIANILIGKANPRGKLAESNPKKLSDNPSYMNFPGKNEIVNYQEGVFVGYRYYEMKELDVLFPFGHGLSYTTFAIGNLRLSDTKFADDSQITATVTITNTGNMNGTEVVQLYIADKTDAAFRPKKELKGFASVELAPSESKDVSFTIDKRSLAWYNVNIKDWYAASGEYQVLIGNSSDNISNCAVFTYETNVKLPLVVTQDTMIGDLLADSRTRDYALKVVIPAAVGDTFKSYNEAEDQGWALMAEAMVGYSPIRNVRAFGLKPTSELNAMIVHLNELIGNKG